MNSTFFSTFDHSCRFLFALLNISWSIIIVILFLKWENIQIKMLAYLAFLLECETVFGLGAYFLSDIWEVLFYKWWMQLFFNHVHDTTILC
jgi:hypothetical protein